MNKLDDLAAVVRLACLTEDRTNPEQRSLLRIARWVDDQANTTMNRDAWQREVRVREPWRLEQLAHETRVLVDDQAEVRLKDRKRAPGELWPGEFVGAPAPANLGPYEREIAEKMGLITAEGVTGG